MARRKKSQKSAGLGAESPETSKHPSLPPKDNLGRCKKCKKMLGVCLIEVSRATPTNGFVAQRAYACRDDAAEVAEELVRTLASWTYWPRGAAADSQEEPEDETTEVNTEVNTEVVDNSEDEIADDETTEDEDAAEINE